MCNEFTLVHLDVSPPLDLSSLILIRSINFILLVMLLNSFFNFSSQIGFHKTYSFLSMVIMSLLTLVIIETFIAYFLPNSIELDGTLGWKLKPNINKIIPRTRMDNTKYDVIFKTDSSSFRTYGDLKNSSKTILVLGDSFTAASYASDDEMWYAQMSKKITEQLNLPNEYFYIKAGGAGGYGTYQNFLLANSLIEELKFDIFIYQFCVNDFNDNFLFKGDVSPPTVLALNRPYWDTDSQTTIFRETPLPYIYKSFLAETKIVQSLESLFLQYNTWRSPPPAPMDYSNISAGNGDASMVETKLLHTESILKKLRMLFPDTHAVMVNCSSSKTPIKNSINNYWQEIAFKTGFIPISAPSDELRRQFILGRKELFNFDRGHFSDKGNILFGNILAKEFLKIPDIKNKIDKY